MELTDILSLVKAGYTREEIEQMEKPQPSDPNPVPAVPPVATPVCPNLPFIHRTKQNKNSVDCITDYYVGYCLQECIMCVNPMNGKENKVNAGHNF